MKKHYPVLLLVLVNLIIGGITLSGYGQSLDETTQTVYGGMTIESVRTLIRTGTFSSEYFGYDNLAQASHGPAFITAVVYLRNLFLASATPVQQLHFDHFLYFLLFQVGVVSFYFLARRWLSEPAAFGATLLFDTQPLIFGHASMNPKDIVFMSLVILSVVLGLKLVDRKEKPAPTTGSLLRDRSRSLFRQFRYADVWLAALVLGFASAVRNAAPIVGILLLVYILFLRKWDAVPRLLVYGLLAFSFMILFWPYLWPDPIIRLIDTALKSAHYPGVHLTVFRGGVVHARQTPGSYVPILLVLQLTETTLLLMAIGALAVLKRLRADLLSILLVWFLLPAVIVITMRVNLYNNLRQLFFIYPPLFVIAGFGLEWLLGSISRPVLRYVALFLILLPGLYANVTLYPYEYIYYNQLVGGVRGAYRVFELDYWRLASKEAQDYVNENAHANAHIFVGDTRSVNETFARPDLIFNDLGAAKKKLDGYDYIIVSTSGNEDEEYAAFPTVFTVEREGVPLIEVKKPH